MIFVNSCLNSLNREFSRKKEAKILTFNNIQKNKQRANEKRDKNYKYNLHDKVYIKLMQKCELDIRYNSPCDVISLMYNRLLVKVDNKTTWINYKRIKPVPLEKG